jgi:phenylacetate-CoA ligase
MMSRHLLLRAATRAKTRGLVDFTVRYNPWLRRRIEGVLRSPTPEARAAQVDFLGQRIIAAARHTRYGAGRSKRLEDWPVLSKQEPRVDPGSFVNRRAFIRVPASSGGTTGAPMQLWRSMECIVAEQLFIDQLLAPHGSSMRSKMAILRADTIKPMAEAEPPYGRISHDGRRLTLSSPHLNAETVSWYVQELQRFAPAIMWVYPSAIVNLLSLMERMNMHLSLPVILASSELLSGSMHAALQRFFNAKVINYYGQAERACFAYSTRPDEFFFNPLYGKVELEPAAPPDPDGHKAMKVIATGFWNTVMPLIRYDTGDLLDVPASFGSCELAEIARGDRPFSSIAGRIGEYVVTREGLRIIGLNHIPREVANIYQVQLVQTGWDTVNVDVLVAAGFSAVNERTLHAQACAKLPTSFNVTVRRVDRLRQTSLGKIPFVIRDI